VVAQIRLCVLEAGKVSRAQLRAVWQGSRLARFEQAKHAHTDRHMSATDCMFLLDKFLVCFANDGWIVQLHGNLSLAEFSLSFLVL
jgi:hypothetical protein